MAVSITILAIIVLEMEERLKHREKVKVTKSLRVFPVSVLDTDANPVDIHLGARASHLCSQIVLKISHDNCWSGEDRSYLFSK